jgi:hypothetical protein
MVFLCDGISVADFIDDSMERNFNAIVKNVGKIATKSAKLASKSSMFPQMSRKIFSSTIYMLPSMLLCCYVAMVYGLWSMLLQHKFSQNDLPNCR